jgi:tetratricopeptide (TPR) repeat protein
MLRRPTHAEPRPRASARRRLYGVLCVLMTFHAAAADAATAKPSEVQDLAYGEVLFEFYQEKYFDAISRLRQAQERRELDYHAGEAELLLGGMSLAYGMDREATRLFNRLLDAGVEPEVRDRAWYYLGRIAFQKDRPADAAAALSHIAGLDDPRQDARAQRLQRAEQRMLLGHVRLAQGDADGAVRAFSDWNGAADERAYADYNLGIALLARGETDTALKLLDRLGEESAKGAEAHALRDKTNLALGYRLLQAGQHAQARPYFDRVRLQGPLSGRALLGAGWADAEQQRYREALVPWLELHSRDGRDAAVQEAWLAVPYAYAQLGAQGRAVELYQDAIAAFAAESRALDAAIAALGEGRLIGTLLAAEGTGRSWFWQLAQVPAEAHTRYLVDLLAAHRFQEAVKNLRDLKELGDRLDAWAGTVQTFEHMIETRRLRYAQHAPRLREDIDRLDVEVTKNRHSRLAAELERIERGDDALGLMTAQERTTLERLTAIDARLAALPDDDRTRAMREKQARLYGLMLWQVHGDYKSRLHTARKELTASVAPIAAAEDLAVRARSAYTTAPTAFEGFDGRIAGLSEQVRTTREQTDRLLAAQAQWVTRLAQTELQLRKHRVDAYLVQARFALAQTYDKAGDSRDGAP